MNGAGVPIAINLDTEHPVELLKVCELYVQAHARIESIHETRPASGG
jgi:hypothetical protein